MIRSIVRSPSRIVGFWSDRRTSCVTRITDTRFVVPPLPPSIASWSDSQMDRGSPAYRTRGCSPASRTRQETSSDAARPGSSTAVSSFPHTARHEPRLVRYCVRYDHLFLTACVVMQGDQHLMPDELRRDVMVTHELHPGSQRRGHVENGRRSYRRRCAALRLACATITPRRPRRHTYSLRLSGGRIILLSATVISPDMN